ncbi:MAG: hypothetical protein ABGY41_17780 [Candidatus Poribacteria bacterium]
MAHDSIVPPLVEFLDTTGPVVTVQLPKGRPKTQADVDRWALQYSTQQTRRHVLRALGASASKEAIGPLFRMLDDPQLSRDALHYLRRLLRSRILSDIGPWDTERFGSSSETPGEYRRRRIAAATAWWERIRDDVELPRTIGFMYH